MAYKQHLILKFFFSASTDMLILYFCLYLVDMVKCTDFQMLNASYIFRRNLNLVMYITIFYVFQVLFYKFLKNILYLK